MSENNCNKCTKKKCKDSCVCPKNIYTSNNCDNTLPFNCVILEKDNKGQDYVLPCLDFKTGNTLLDLLKKVETIKCDLRNNNNLDEKVKISASDSTPGYLADKILAGDCITWNPENIAGNIGLKPVLDFKCIYDKIKLLPDFCNSVTACVQCIAPANSVTRANTISNTCPSYIVDLNSLIVSSPLNTIQEWHLNNTHTDLIANPTTFNILNNPFVYLFTRTNLTQCYSAHVLFYKIKNDCTPPPKSRLNCGAQLVVVNGLFQKGIPSNGIISIPIIVTAPADVVSITISGQGFSNNGPSLVNVTQSTTSVQVAVSYDGSGTAGPHTITASLNGGASCNYTINVSCKPCILLASDVTITNVSYGGFQVNIANLESNPNCQDKYDISFSNVVNSGPRIDPSSIQIFTNQTSPTFVFTRSPGSTENIEIRIIKKCCCGNDSLQYSVFQPLPSCPPCTLANSVTITNPTSTGFQVNVANLISTASCQDKYDITFTNAQTGTIYSQSAINQISPIFVFSQGAINDSIIINITKKCCCGDLSLVYTTQQKIEDLCPPCNLVSSDVIITNPTATGFQINISGLQSTRTCQDRYDIALLNVTTGLFYSQSAINQTSPVFIFSQGSPNDIVRITITKKCCCGNNSSPYITQQQIQQNCPPCRIVSTDVTYTNPTASGFQVNIANLVSTVSCKDTYNMIFRREVSGPIIGQALLNQTNPVYIFNQGFPGDNIQIEIVKNCCCGNQSPVYTGQQIIVECSFCTVGSNNVSITNQTATGFDVNIGDLIDQTGCQNTYDITFTVMLNGQIYVQSYTNQSQPIFSFTQGNPDAVVEIGITKKCCCNNTTSSYNFIV